MNTNSEEHLKRPALERIWILLAFQAHVDARSFLSIPSPAEHSVNKWSNLLPFGAGEWGLRTARGFSSPSPASCLYAATSRLVSKWLESGRVTRKVVDGVCF